MNDPKDHMRSAESFPPKGWFGCPKKARKNRAKSGQVSHPCFLLIQIPTGTLQFICGKVYPPYFLEHAYFRGEKNINTNYQRIWKQETNQRIAIGFEQLWQPKITMFQIFKMQNKTQFAHPKVKLIRWIDSSFRICSNRSKVLQRSRELATAKQRTWTQKNSSWYMTLQ